MQLRETKSGKHEFQQVQPQVVLRMFHLSRKMSVWVCFTFQGVFLRLGFVLTLAGMALVNVEAIGETGSRRAERPLGNRDRILYPQR